MELVLRKPIESGVEGVDQEKLPVLLESKCQSLEDAMQALGEISEICLWSFRSGCMRKELYRKYIYPIVMMKFSQRIGKNDVRKSLQSESMDKQLTNRIWNDVYWFINNISDAAPYGELSNREKVISYIWKEFLEQLADEIPNYGGGINTSEVIRFLKEQYFLYSWYEKYDLVEFISKLDLKIGIGFTDKCNYTLKFCMAGYRIIKNQIVPVTSEEEVIEIEKAILNTDPWESVNAHLVSSITLLSDRESPNYRNSIKESISAVEAMFKIITGDKNATLGKTLKIVEQKYKIHPALRSAFNSLYGYSSDSGGIRHSLMEGDIEIMQEDAKFMLVSCSAFINYVKAKI